MNSSLTDRTPEEAVDLIAALGFEAVEFLVSATLMPQEAAPSRRRALRRRCADRNVAVVGLNGALPATGHRILSDDRRERQTGLDQLIRVVDLCADLGGGVVTVGSPGARNAPSDAPPDVWYPRAVEAFRQWADYAGPAGIGIALEIINRFECNWGRTIAEGRAFLAAAGHPNLGLTIDTFHMGIEEGPFAPAIAQAGPHLKHVHAADSNRQAPGQGNLPFRTILAALQTAGYRGLVSVELYSQWYGIPLAQPAEEALRQGHDHLRGLLAEAADPS